MSNITLPYRYKMRGYTAAECASKNEVLLEREWCFETDTGKAKQGDGETPWNDLPYATVGFVDFTDLADGTVLTWDATAGMFVFTTPSGGVSDGDKGDITVTGGVWSVDAGAITYAKMQDVSAASRLLGRGSAAGSGDPEEITLGANLSMTGNVLSASGSSGSFDPSTTDFKHNDFEDFAGSGWITSNAGGSATNYTATVTAGRPGVIALTTLTSSTAIAGILDSGSNYYVFGGGTSALEYGFQIPTLSTATERFSVSIGWRDVGAASPTNQLVLSYIDNNNSGNWVFRSVVGGVTTDVNAASGPSAGTWYRVRIEVNAAGTSAECFINGASIGTTTAIPAGAMRRAVVLVKSVGTNARLLLVDYSTRSGTFTTPR